MKRRDIDVASFKLFSPYGGLIYLESPGFKKPHSISVRISGAMEAPLFDLTADDYLKKWQESVASTSAPWADICGKYISFTMPTSSVKDIKDPTEVMETWDRVVKTHYELRGNDVEKERHQWIVCDVQPVAGYMHSGYPIVTMMDVSKPQNTDKFLLNNESVLSEGRWGMYHELGHNMQRRFWTFKGTGEVTCNIFSLHAMDVVSNKKPWIHEWLAKHLPKMKKALNSNDPYEQWQKSPGIALGVYAQLQHSFGWEAYKTVFAHYEALDNSDKPKGDKEEISYWIEIFSNTVGYNLCPLFEFWGFKIPGPLRKKLTQTPFLPDDEMTALAPDRIKMILKDYPNAVRHVEQKCG